MNVSLHELVTLQFSTTLEALNNILTKAEQHASDRGFSADAFLATRFAPDMFALARQVQISTDIAKGAVARLTNTKAPVFEDNETTMADLKIRIGRTIEFIAGTKEKDYEGYEKLSMTFPWVPGKALGGKDFLVGHAIPNFYFHVATTYDLLRMAGVNLGKADFLGKQNWKEL
tara:strand:- start:3863 stop:4381 length:519 start_codon:yes stop_codon:yes gene_type:complete